MIWFSNLVSINCVFTNQMFIFIYIITFHLVDNMVLIHVTLTYTYLKYALWLNCGKLFKIQNVATQT